MMKRCRTVLVATLSLMLSQAVITPSTAKNVTTVWSHEGQAGRTYTFVDLGVLGHSGSTSSASDLNAAGQVVGTSTITSPSMPHAFLWQHGHLQDLGAIFSASSAQGINASAEIVGYTDINNLNPPHAFLYRNGKMIDLGTGLGSGSESMAFAINSAGQVVGEHSMTRSSAERAVLWSHGSIRELGTLGGHCSELFCTDSIAYDINDYGQVVGTALPPQPPLHAFLWQHGVMQDLGTLDGMAPGNDSRATAINNAGQVVGASQIGGPQTPHHAFLWQHGVMQDLGTLGSYDSYAYGINSSGQVVGVSRTPTSPYANAGDAFLWEGGKMVDLNHVVTNLPPGVVLEVAQAINDAGLIVGTTCTYACPRGTKLTAHAFLLVPNA